MGELISKDAAVAVAEGYWGSIGGGMPEGPSDEAILDTIEAISAGLRALEPAPDLAELVEALRCAVDDYEAHNGRIVSDTDPHWSVSARAALAKIKASTP